MHGVACVGLSVLFKAAYYSDVHINHIFCDRSPVDEHLGCFHLLATVDKAATDNAGVKIWVLIFISFRYIPIKIAGSYGN